MKNLLTNPRLWIILTLDVLLLVVVHALAYFIRFEGQLSLDEWTNFKVILPFLIALKLFIFYWLGLYRGIWRYTSLSDLLNILKASLLSFFIAAGTLLFIQRFEGFSRSVFILDGIFTFLAVAGLRVAIRFHYQGVKGFSSVTYNPAPTKQKKNLLIIGAGDAAEKLLRELNDNKNLPYRVCGLIDDNQHKIGRRIHGIRVLGATDNLSNIVKSSECQAILIAIPSATKQEITRIVELCQRTRIPFKTLPGMGELINGKISIKAIRDVAYRDLLGRPSVRLELGRIENILRDKTILVTGAGGSIGSELCRQILLFHPGRLILFDAGEQNLYQIEMEIRHEHGFTNYVSVLGKVQDKELLTQVFTHYQPEIVFHAAAYKHVPMIELNPWEAVHNNILASKYLMEIAINSGSSRFILVSTDKAVRPTNVMGASKRVTEMLLQNFCSAGTCTVMPPPDTGHQEQREKRGPQNSGPHTRLMAVRFGNVLGSSGSVIPLFRRQIEMGGPVTVTDPKMTRYFMSISEAAQLILQACSLEDDSEGIQLTDNSQHVSGGEIFILKMGTPVKIDQMARDLIKLCGKEPDTEIEIKYTGLRPGEKLYEELITEGEGIVPTGHEKIMVLRQNRLNHEEKILAPKQLSALEQQIIELEALAQKFDAKGIRGKLQEIVNDYDAKESEAVL